MNVFVLVDECCEIKGACSSRKKAVQRALDLLELPDDDVEKITSLEQSEIQHPENEQTIEIVELIVDDENL